MSIEAYPSPNGVLTSLIWRFTAQGGETSLSGYDNAAQALSYTPGQEQVYLNGILLVRGDDYTATNGTSITNLVALAEDDFVQINCYSNFSVATINSGSIIGTIDATQIDTDIARLDSPTFTGVPLAPTASSSTNTTQIATTEYVTTAVNNVINAAPGALNTLDELAAALGDDANYATTVTNALAAKAPINNPTFTGTVTIPSGAQISYPTVMQLQSIGIGRTAAMFEKASVSATAATGTVNIALQNNPILYYTSNATGNFTINLYADAANTVGGTMNNNDSVTGVFMCTNGSTAYYATGITVDGYTPTVKWQGGSAPSSGNASSIDVYTVTAIKTGTNTYTVLASVTKFA